MMSTNPETPRQESSKPSEPTSVTGWRLAAARNPGSIVYGCVVIGGVSAFIAWACGKAGLDEGVYVCGAIAVIAFLAIGPLVWAAGRWKRRAQSELRERIGERDPGDSPVAWISTELWRRANRWDIEMESQLGAPDPMPSVDAAILVVTDAEDRARAPVIEIDNAEPIPASGSGAELEQQLRAPPLANSLLMHCPSWPVCCDRLATLIGYDLVDDGFVEVLPRAYYVRAESEKWGDGGEDAVMESSFEGGYDGFLPDGVAVYHCRQCGRVYLGSYHP